MALVIENLCHIYNAGEPFEAVALKDVNLRIEEGEFVALIGHTGSGKSTLAQHLNGLIKPTSGRVLFDDKDINQKDSKENFRFKIGLVFQYPEYQLFDESVKKDIAFGPKNMGLDENEIDLRVKKAMATVGLNYEEFSEKSPFELSGGQMRRVALAGVLAMEPSVLVLDEPSAGLDPRAKEFLLQDIKHLNEQGKTIIMISHNMDDVARFAKRVLVMKKGKIVLDGTPSEVFQNIEELEAMGLDIPKASKLSRLLIDRGVEVENCFDIDSLSRAILKAFKGRGKL